VFFVEIVACCHAIVNRSKHFIANRYKGDSFSKNQQIAVQDLLQKGKDFSQIVLVCLKELTHKASRVHMHCKHTQATKRSGDKKQADSSSQNRKLRVLMKT
jgi:hypothetical protein